MGLARYHLPYEHSLLVRERCPSGRLNPPNVHAPSPRAPPPIGALAAAIDSPEIDGREWTFGV